MDKSAEFYFQRSQRHFDEGNVESAFTDLDLAITLDPNKIEYRVLRGELRYQAQEYQDALEDLTVIIQTSSNKDEIEEAYVKRATSYEKLGSYEKLVEDLSWMISHGMETSNRYLWRGHHNQKLGRFNDAIADFLEASRLSPDNHEILLQLGQCRYHAEQYERAIEDLSEITNGELNSIVSSVVYHWRGMSYYKHGDIDLALQDFNEVMRLDGNQPLSNVSEYIGVYQGTE